MREFLLGAALAALPAVSAAAQSPDVKAGVDAWGRGDWRAAVEKWRPLAVSGDPDAQFNLAQAYKLGRGVPEDPAMAESWFRRAALQGHAQAEDNYGLALFQAGKRAEALPWLEKSVARGEPRAQLVLGTMIFNGDGVKRDHPRAYALMSRASAAGLRSASQTLAEMDAHVAPADRQRGLELARQYEAQARLAQVEAAPRVAYRPADPPPTMVTAATPRPAPMAQAQPASPAARPAAPAPRAAPARVAASRPAAPARAATGSRYRVQLGAFRDPANARALWSKVGARVGGQPSYAAADGFTRLQAGPYRTRAEAQRACAKAGVSCVVVNS